MIRIIGKISDQYQTAEILCLAVQYLYLPVSCLLPTA
jgi:hypothetical protein